MMQHQGPRSSDEHVDVQDLLRSLPRVGAADGFEQNLMKRVEAENLNVAYQLGNLPKVPAVGDFNDRLHWSIAVHNQISGGVAAEAIETAVAVESTGGRLWLRTGLALLAVAIGFGSWAVMGDGSAPHAAAGTARVQTEAAPAATPQAASAPRVRLHTAETGIISAVDPNQVAAASPVAAAAPMDAAQQTVEVKGMMTSSPVVRRSMPLMQPVPVSSAVKSATINYGATAPVTLPTAAPATAPVEQRPAATQAQRHEAGDPIQIQVEIGTSNGAASHSQPGIQTGAPEQVGEGGETPTDSIHTGEHRTDDPLAP